MLIVEVNKVVPSDAVRLRRSDRGDGRKWMQSHAVW